MTNNKQVSSLPPVLRVLVVGLIAVTCGAMCGCQDGPLYALKVANPYYSLGEWRRDEAIGVTDHQRRKQLAVLADTAHQLPEDKQRFWAGHLQQMIENDQSPEMRRLAVRAAGRMNVPSAGMMIEQGLDDDSMKVRMEACYALGRRGDDESARMLAATIGTETSQDVKHAAMESLANHRSTFAVNALKNALSDRNPATRDLAVQTLQSATGKNYGDDPQVWIAALDGKEVPEAPTRFAERVRELF